MPNELVKKLLCAVSFLAIVLTAVSREGLVLCLGSEGHVAVEACHKRSCTGDPAIPNEFGVDPDSPAFCEQRPSEPCVDVPLASQSPGTFPAMVKIPGSAPQPAAFLQWQPVLTNPLVTARILERTNSSQNDATGIALRSTVLLI